MLSKPLRSPRLALAACGLIATTAQALPMGSVDTWMVMGDFAARSGDFAVNYALTPRDALGGAVGRWRTEPEAGSRRREYGALAYTRLLQRWNLPDAQANLWFVGLAGRLRDEAGSRSLLAPAVLADYETTRVYVSGGLKTMHAGRTRQHTAYARAGFSFYEVDYDEIQPWFVLEARRMRGLSDETEITPMLRLIHKRYFVELGVNTAKQARASFMYIF
jgi:hypothetical protein